jgi:hypothetical protein
MKPLHYAVTDDGLAVYREGQKVVEIPAYDLLFILEDITKAIRRHFTKE